MVWKFTFLSDSLFWALFFEKPTFKSTFLSTFLWVQLFWVLFWVLFWERYFFEYFFEDSKKCIYFFEYFLEWVSFFEPLKKVVLLFWVLFWALFFYFSELATFMDALHCEISSSSITQEKNSLNTFLKRETLGGLRLMSRPPLNFSRGYQIKSIINQEYDLHFSWNSPVVVTMTISYHHLQAVSIIARRQGQGFVVLGSSKNKW